MVIEPALGTAAYTRGAARRCSSALWSAVAVGTIQASPSVGEPVIPVNVTLASLLPGNAPKLTVVVP